VFGGVVLAVHAIAQLGPWVVRTLAGQPRWLTLAIVGALLLGLGATYERRLRELRSARMQLNSLR
jgi:drug/metabolite transporter (DMT)-like permease